MPLSPEAQRLFTIITSCRLYTPRRVLQGVLNAIAYFQGVVRDVLDELIERTCFVWVDDVVL